jgi:hypothetical protein
MGEIIDHHQVVLIARHAENRRSPQVAMDKLKHTSGMRGRRLKGKTNMTAQLARMTQVLIVSPRAPNVGNTTELHQGIPARMAEAAVPSSGGSSGGESGGGERMRRR